LVGRQGASRKKRSGGGEAEREAEREAKREAEREAKREAEREAKREAEREAKREAKSRSEQQRQWRQWRKRTRDGQPVVDRVRFQVGGFRGRMLKTNLGENALCAKISGDNLAANAI
jgi:sRNA-binding protein